MNENVNVGVVNNVNPSPVPQKPVEQVKKVEVVNDDFDEIDIKISKVDNGKDSYFDGKFTHFLGYKYLSSFLKMSGIGAAWGEEAWGHYKYNHSIYDGKRVKFEGKGLDLFPEMFKWTLFSILTFGIYLFWVPVRKEQWLVSHLHYEDEEYVEGYSFFDGGVLGLIGVNLFTWFLSAISFGLLLPYAFCFKKRWYAKHTVISRKRLVFEGTTLGLFGNYIKWWFLSIITLGIYALWVPLKMLKWEVMHTRIKRKSDIYAPTSKIPMIIGVVGMVLLGFLLISGLSNFSMPSIKGSKNAVKSSSSLESSKNRYYNEGADDDYSYYYNR